MIQIDKDVLMGIKSLAEENHPNEIIVLLRGKRSGGDFLITAYLIPPFGFGSRRSASGNLSPSTGDMHNFYGRLMMIIGPPYSMNNIAAYTKRGKAIPVKVVSD